MPKYDIKVEVSATAWLKIDAKNEEEAEDEAWDEPICSVDLDDIEIEGIESIELAEGEEEPAPTQEELEAKGQLNLLKQKEEK